MAPSDDNHDPDRSLDLHVQATYRLTEALFQAEQQMLRRINLLSEVVLETDRNGVIVFLNDAWQSVLGLPSHGALGHSLGEFLVPEDRSLWDRAVAEALVGPLQTAPALRFPRADGTNAWMELSLAPIPEGGLVGALRDITRSKQIQDEMKLLSLVASYTQNLVVITNHEGLTEWVNSAFTKHTGYTMDDLVGRKPGELLQGPETDPHTVAQISGWLKAGRTFSCELLNYTKRGDPYWVVVNITPIRNAEGVIERFVSVQTDSSELHRTQAELEAAKIRAEASNAAKSRFLATISHEMRTPLNAVIGSSELALIDRRDSLALEDHLQRIRENGDQLLCLINDVLDVSKIEAGQIDIELTQVKLRPLLEQVLETMASRALAKGLKLTFDWDPALPDQVFTDRGRLRQILTNLVENAVKFTDTGHVQVAVNHLAAGPQVQEQFELMVQDSGVGISAEAQTRIFDAFEQGDSSNSRRKAGVGLGLNIVRSIAMALGGTVSLISHPGAGSELRVRLPLLRAVGSLKADSRAQTDQPRRQVSASGNHILVAEDNNVNFTVLKAMLAKGGYTLERAHDGHEAVAAAPRCDLVLMDLEMPGMDGLEATRAIRCEEELRGGPPVPVIALTAHALKEYQERCWAAGCTAYLTKPIRMNELLDAVAGALGSSGENASEP